MDYAGTNHTKSNMYKKMKSHPGNEFIGEAYKKINNRVNNLRKQLKAKYMGEKVDRCLEKGKSVWKVLKEATCVPTTTTTNIQKLNYNGTSLTDGTDIANAMNNFYINVGPNLASLIPPTDPPFPPPPATENSMILRNVTPEQVRKSIMALSNKKSSSNGINNILLKILVDTVDTQLCSKPLRRPRRRPPGLQDNTSPTCL